MKHKFLIHIFTILACITSIAFGQLINPYALTVSGGGGGGGGLTLIASDNFDSYANGALLESQTGWTTFLGSMEVYKPLSNGMVTAGSGNLMVRRTDAFSTNQRSEAIAATFNPGSYRTLAVGVRCQSGGADTRYFFSTDGGTIAYLIARVAGVQTVINNGSFAPTLTAGDGIALEATGTGSATRLTVQVRRSGVWSNLTGYVNIDPGVYIDGGYPGIGGDQSTFVDSGADSWAGYNLDGATVPTPDLLHWPLNDASGSTIVATVGSGTTANTGTLNSNYLSVAGANGTFQATSNTTWGSNIVSVSFWFRKSEWATNGVVFRSCYINNYPNFQFLQAGVTTMLNVVGTSGEFRQTADYIMPLNTWSHVVIVFDNSTVTGNILLYVDGSPVSLTTTISTKAGTGNFATDQLSIKSIFGELAVFDMDDLRIYSGQISAPSIATIFAAGRP